MKRKGFTLIELLVVIAIIGILASLLLPALSSVLEKSKQMKCKANLSNIGKTLEIYKQDYGRQKKFPEADGSTFVCSIYNFNLLLEVAIFLCPSVADESTPDDLRDAGDLSTPTSSDGAAATDEGATSYSGRKNTNQRQYPGIYTTKRDTTITPMAADDWQGAEGEGNHEAGQLVNFLFVDTHVEHVRIKEVADQDPLPDDHGYTFFQSIAFPDAENPNLADPVTN
jgi:prepilin-type N-terminal cleavage/methylation domain-containing protein/prepilin-type processing-associated H-X9-DG protein